MFDFAIMSVNAAAAFGIGALGATRGGRLIVLALLAMRAHCSMTAIGTVTVGSPSRTP